MSCDLPYAPCWGGGCKEVTITKEELHEYLVEHGWPSDESLRSKRTPAQELLHHVTPDIEVANDYSIWGIDRQPRNIDRALVNRARFDICEKGLFNILEHRLGKEVAGAGDLMLVFSGPSLSRPDQMHRCACIVAGTCYSPKVWDAACLCFDDPAQVHSLAFQLPCWVRLASRDSLLTGQKITVDLNTSDQFILGLVQDMAEVEVLLAD